jgi:predicted nucleotidyltransferase
MTPQRLSFLEHPASTLGIKNLYLETDVGVIDVLSSILGVGDFERLKSSAEELRVVGRTYRLISLDDLIAAKEAMGREKDLLAVKELRAVAVKRKAREAP